MVSWLKRFWPPVVAASLLGATFTAHLLISLKWTAGHLVYALDDTYIHMAMAKNFARHGVWGVTPYAFTSASSSPLWTLLLAGCDVVFGVNDVSPLVLNVLFASLLVFALAGVMEDLEPSLPRSYVLGVLVAVLFFAPIPSLIFVGMEHVLHSLVTLLLIYSAGKILSQRGSGLWAARTVLVSLGVLACAARYEGLFAVAVIAGALLARRRWRLAVVLGFCAALPLAIVSVISVAQGWYALPNSVLLKGNVPQPGSGSALVGFLAHVGMNVTGSGLRVARLVAIALLLILYRFSKGKGSTDPLQWIAGIFAATAILHLVFAGAGWFFRYEAYLIVLGFGAMAPPLFEFLRQFPRTLRLRAGEFAGVTALIVLMSSGGPFWDAGYGALLTTPRATLNTYQWHYQMGRFVSRYYSHASLALNDIGAVDFMADVHCTDFHGLADMGVARAMRAGRFNPSAMDAIARSRGAFVALVDDNWLNMYGGTPRNWLLAGRWKFSHRVVLAPPLLSFYALNEDARARLMANLRDFSSQLPPDVEQLGPYMEAAKTSPDLNQVNDGTLQGTIHPSQ